ncbi:MAG: cupin-like domain-containing protein [Rubrivivax sp.]|nr:MAG: cupin-like domain-containing protein [Rubrivivax sp.]
MNTPVPSLGRAAERRDVDAAVFRNEILPGNRPVLMRGLVDRWPVVQQGKGSPMAACESLLQFYRGAQVPLLIGDPSARRHIFYEEGMKGLNFERRLAPLIDGLRLLMQHVDNADAPAIYMEALPVPRCLPDFTAAHRLPLLGDDVIPNIWIGNAVKVQTHFDLAYNIAIVVAGKRRFTLFPPEQLPNLYPGPIDFTPGGTPVSMVPLDNPDLARFPRFEQALEAALVAELEPGDALYIPYAWWHHVQSLEGFNVLINYWWDQAPPPAPPYDALLHAVLAFRDLPTEERRFWQGMFEYFVFETSGPALGHLAPQHRGHMGPASPERAAAIKAVLAQAFKRS